MKKQTEKQTEAQIDFTTCFATTTTDCTNPLDAKSNRFCTDHLSQSNVLTTYGAWADQGKFRGRTNYTDRQIVLIKNHTANCHITCKS